jgi:hypothetical protein
VGEKMRESRTGVGRMTRSSFSTPLHLLLLERPTGDEEWEQQMVIGRVSISAPDNKGLQPRPVLSSLRTVVARTRRGPARSSGAIIQTLVQ